MPETLKQIETYTDGACSGNPGPGGWAAILLYQGKERVVSGGEAATTNNRMELKAVVEGLRVLNQSCVVTVYSDSAYLIDAMTKGWIIKWQKNGWKTTGKDDVKNKDLWEALLDLQKKHRITWSKVKGHADNFYNNRCDELARAEIDALRKNADAGIA